MSDRYDASNLTEGQYQSGSNDLVLINKLGITDPNEMNQVELELLDQLYDAVISNVTESQTILVSDLKEWHHKWLSNVYDWAGRERSVNISKGDFQFAASDQLPRLLNELDKKYLYAFTPCVESSEDNLIDAIAVVHIEFLLLHPFRDGNGRLARLLANVMALQANWPELDFSVLDGNRDQYFAAIQTGMDCNYEPMKKLIRQVLHDSESL